MKPPATALFLACILALGACGGGGERPAAEEPERVDREHRETVRRFWDRFTAAEALRREGRWAEASAVYDEALAADPNHERALYSQANCLLELGRHAEALPYLRRLVAINPLSQRAHVQLAFLHSTPESGCCFDLDVAKRELERAVEINREETGALMRLAELHLARSDFDEASRVLEQVRATNSHSVGAPWLLAWLAHRQGLDERSGQLLDEALVRARGPALPSAVPGEGDTRGDHRLVESTLPGKRIVRPVWEDLDARHGDEDWSREAMTVELGRLVVVLPPAPGSAASD